MGFPFFPHLHRVLHTPAIWHPSPAVPREGYAVVLFRRAFRLARPVEKLAVWVSASQRFELFLDGELLARGPARSDPTRWGCARVVLPRLGRGRHVLAARVAHFGDHAGIGQMGGPGFFLLCADTEAKDLAAQVNTGAGWRCCHDRSRAPVVKHVWGRKPPYYAVGCGELVCGADAPWGWERRGFADRSWSPAKVVCHEVECPWGNVRLGHILRPEVLPQMEERLERLARVAEVPAELRGSAARWLRGAGRLTIPARARVRLVLDRGELTNAYPLLTVSSGKGSRIRVVSAEAPYARDGSKGPRGVTAGKVFRGHRDEFLPDGGRRRTFTTLWFRSFRYLELSIRTGGAPLVLEDLRVRGTAFPLREEAAFHADAARRPLWDAMWAVSWRTARLCAHETFFDCPHYEQAQFPGDTRVQAMYHYLVAGEDRLARKALDDFHASRLPEGLTQCRFPSRKVQILPTFSLYWIGMLHDFRVYRGDLDFLRFYLPAAREVLAWYERRRRGDGLLGYVDYAPFMDWTRAFACGNAPQERNGGSSILSLLFAEACGWMAGLERACGFPELAGRWARLSRALAQATLAACWDSGRGLLADTAVRSSFSQHAQVQAILAGAWPAAQARAVLARALDDKSVTQPGTHYYRYYVAQALKRCGLRERFFPLLDPWARNLRDTGLTTWPETDVNPRSDCHAWSVTPAIEFLQTVLGVEPDPEADGFGRLLFGPTLGPATEARGTVPTPRGTVRVHLRRARDGAVTADLTTPVPAVVLDERRVLRPGRHRFLLKSR